jgi:hypothetical protein
MNGILIYLIYTKYKDQDCIDKWDFVLVRQIVNLTRKISDFAGQHSINRTL